MTPVKRIEIIIDAPEVPALLATLRENGVSGYSVISPVTGAGERGERRNDEPGGGSGNACILTAVPSEQAPALIEALRPVLKRRGGVCLVSDALWVIH
ncbi:MAG: transcriptional regulator [Chthoniobacteraceae bacterium]